MKNVGEIKDCFGCGICAVSCPVKIIDINLNENGFYEPRITDDSKCIKCGLCLNNCAFNHSELASQPEKKQSWGAWSNNEQIQRKCSSGGIGFEICRQLIARGYKVIACRYNPERQIAEHYVAETETELIESIGSKYIQSLTPDALKLIKRNEKYAIVGTPCQIDSLRRFVKQRKLEDNVVLIDFFCHCVPSMWAWNGYLRMVEKEIGKVEYASWRNKLEYGWHDSYIMNLDNKPVKAGSLEEVSGKWIKRMSRGDIFYKLFLGDIALNPACSKNCKYKMDNSSADIRLGDFWGKTYRSDDSGVSSVVAFTEKGAGVINSLSGVTLQSHSFETVTEGQMKRNAQPKAIAPVVMTLLKNKVPLNSGLYSSAFICQKIINRIKRYLKL